MKLLLVTTYFEPDSGAAAVRLARLARHLAHNGHDVTVLTTLPHYPQGKIDPAYRGHFTRIDWLDGVRVVRTWLWATPSARISRKLISQISFLLAGVLRGLPLPRPDVILIEAQPVFTNLAGVLLAGIKRVPYVLNISDLWPDHLLSVGVLNEHDLVYQAARQVVDFTYRNAAEIAVMSPAWGRAIAGYIGTDETLHVIYNGVDLERFAPGASGESFRRKYDLDDRKILSFISTFTTPYDFDTLLAVAEAFKDREDVQVVFCGGGSQQDRLEAWLATDPMPNVRYLGWIDYADVPAAWAASDVTYLALRDNPLYAGTIPAKFYEVLASGVPLVCAVRGEAARMVEASNGGIVTPPGDVAGLVAGINHLLDDDDARDGHARSARAYAEANFNPAEVARRYERLLSRARRGF
jgi:colanic acid biosynthesis glycosyl transferase WcaI